ncbi:hypothetical protein FRC08_018221 [Ceratobasidium sp. 394]|nr:hypothetical protein FRC08_018221 [Ceratobasidium sp. 394]
MDAKAALSRASEDDLYLGHDNLATKTEWKMGGAGAGNQDVLTDKAGNPAVLSVVATLLGDKNYFNPEAGYDPAHETTWQASYH